MSRRNETKGWHRNDQISRALLRKVTAKVTIPAHKPPCNLMHDQFSPLICGFPAAAHLRLQSRRQQGAFQWLLQLLCFHWAQFSSWFWGLIWLWKALFSRAPVMMALKDTFCLKVEFCPPALRDSIELWVHYCRQEARSPMLLAVMSWMLLNALWVVWWSLLNAVGVHLEKWERLNWDVI